VCQTCTGANGTCVAVTNADDPDSCSGTCNGSSACVPKFVDIPLDTTNWEGALYSSNVYVGPWTPTLDASGALFAPGGVSWGMWRTKASYDFGKVFTCDLEVNLASGGTYDDAAKIGIGDGWPRYQGRFVGLMFITGSIYVHDSIVPGGGRVRIIGKYAAGDRTTWTLTVRSDGSLGIHRPGFPTENYTATQAIPASYRFMVSGGDTTDGARLHSVSVDASAQ